MTFGGVAHGHESSRRSAPGTATLGVAGAWTIRHKLPSFVGHPPDVAGEPGACDCEGRHDGSRRGLVVLPACPLELQLELQLRGLVLERRFDFPDAFLDGLDDPVLLLKALQLLPGRATGAVLQVVDLRLQGRLDDGRGDLPALVGLTGRGFPGWFPPPRSARPAPRRCRLRGARSRPSRPGRRLGSGNGSRQRARNGTKKVSPYEVLSASTAASSSGRSLRWA